MKFGIGSYTFGWETGAYGPELTDPADRISAHELVDRAVRYGARVVQIVNVPALDRMGDDELRALRAYGSRHGVEFEVGTIGSDPETLRGWLRAARMLGARLMRTLLPDPSPGLAIEREQLSEILPDLRADGVVLGIENHETSSIHELRALVDDLGEGVGVCLDTVNSLGRGEGVQEVIDALMPVTVNLHVKDFTTTRGSTDMGFTITGAPTGEGRLDIPALLARAHATDPGMSVILEQWTPIAGSLSDAIAEQERWAEIGARYLSAALAALK